MGMPMVSMTGMIIIVMILVMMTFCMVAMVIIVMIVVMPVVIMTLVNMNAAVKVFSFTPHQGWTHGRLNCKAAVVGKAPFEDHTELAINCIVLRTTIQIVLESTMTFNRDDRSGAEFTGRQLFSPAPMATMGLGTANGSISSHQQCEGRESVKCDRTRVSH